MRQRKVRQAIKGGFATPETQSLLISSEGWTRGYRLGKVADGKKEGIFVQGRRVPITKREFLSLCDLHYGALS